jgi:hypothetical protein
MQPTTEKLAQALEATGDANLAQMVQKARAGYYDDFKSELALPIIQLIADLRDKGHEELAQRAMSGEFDSTPEESAAWVAGEGKDYLPAAIWEEFGYESATKQGRA